MSDDLAPPDGSAWDLLVIGGGTAGIVAAQTAVGFGASVLLVERDRTGGDCLWTGCVPSKALLAAAHAAAEAGAAHTFGVHVDGVRVDFAQVMAHVRAAITAIEPDDSPAALRRAGVTVARADTALTGTATATVGGSVVRFRQALLATGAAPAMPAIPGLEQAGPLTSETLWDTAVLPDQLLILGGGNIGCELGQAFARLGSQVTLVESAARLLPREDPDAARLVHDALAADGVDIRVRSAVTRVHDGRATLPEGTEVAFDAILVAVGRTPRTAGLGLDTAGVATGQDGYVAVDAHLRTSNPRIWAAGDITGHPQFTHTAGVHGSLAASNAILGLRRSADGITPRVTYTQPELAAFGETAQAAEGFTLRTLHHDEVDRAVTDQQTAGLCRLMLDRKGRVVAATLVGPRAGECLAELVLAAEQGLRTRDLAAVTHAYPTYADAAWKIAIADLQEQLRRPVAHRATTALAAVRRRWLDR